MKLNDVCNYTLMEFIHIVFYILFNPTSHNEFAEGSLLKEKKKKRMKNRSVFFERQARMTKRL